MQGRAVAFQHWPNECREIDILISSTAAQEPLLTPEILGPMIRERLQRPLFIIDAAVPRDVAPEVNEMGGVFLCDIDALQTIVERSLALRRLQIAPADVDSMVLILPQSRRRSQRAKNLSVTSALPALKFIIYAVSDVQKQRPDGERSRLRNVDDLDRLVGKLH